MKAVDCQVYSSAEGQQVPTEGHKQQYPNYNEEGNSVKTPGSSKPNLKNRNFYSKNELEALDVADFPQPIKGEDLSDLLEIAN